ncbi:hypothetical protein [Azohydromonas lata]|uniref:hypothetical protein n=1 Tax=Azohydromonas lata TaxID=45677 RepID=UPI0012F4CB93|nr:hypothetical protein [Azohydromonas lata]
MCPVVVLKAPAPEGVVDHAAYVARGGYRLLKRCVAGELDVEMVLRSVGESGLFGAQGPAAMEWERVHREPTPRLMEACAGQDERSGGDRVLLQRNPHRCFEGLLIAAWAMGASHLRLMLVRGGHAALQAMLAAELVKLRRRRPYPGMPDIVLGCCDTQPRFEAGISRLRQGIETLYWVPDILDGGAEWFAAQRMRPRMEFA